MKYALTVLATLVVLLLLALVFPYTGIYNVAATDGHTDFGQWFLNTTSTKSIQARADGIAVPADLADSTRVVRGAGNYAAMCQTCHGGPGAERGEIGKGMAPQPPRLSEAAPEWTPEEIYWILDHGIKNAGMPAFSPTHDEEALWDLVAFTKQLPEMTPERYEMLVAVSPGHHGEEGHGHGEHEHEQDGGTMEDGEAEGTGHQDDGHTH